ncbi:Hypothetical protein CINCED_3A017971 [Cinara cedri]|uniref:Uncharacterized protein n=1 Tax=Cinara cedri TaxID=506608 RepID=A0A5E4MAK7_9HEMI|nr:Hypothetical protein CINCED_3A017971 [Cinara cedri]
MGRDKLRKARNADEQTPKERGKMKSFKYGTARFLKRKRDNKNGDEMRFILRTN